MIAVAVNGGTFGEIIWFVSWAAIFPSPLAQMGLGREQR